MLQDVEKLQLNRFLRPLITLDVYQVGVVPLSESICLTTSLLTGQLPRFSTPARMTFGHQWLERPNCRIISVDALEMSHISFVRGKWSAIEWLQEVRGAMRKEDEVQILGEH